MAENRINFGRGERGFGEEHCLQVDTEKITCKDIKV